MSHHRKASNVNSTKIRSLKDGRGQRRGGSALGKVLIDVYRITGHWTLWELSNPKFELSVTFHRTHSRVWCKNKLHFDISIWIMIAIKKLAQKSWVTKVRGGGSEMYDRISLLSLCIQKVVFVKIRQDQYQKDQLRVSRWCTHTQLDSEHKAHQNTTTTTTTTTEHNGDSLPTKSVQFGSHWVVFIQTAVPRTAIAFSNSRTFLLKRREDLLVFASAESALSYSQ